MHQSNKSRNAPPDRTTKANPRTKKQNFVRNNQNLQRNKPVDRKPPKKYPPKAADKSDARAKAAVGKPTTKPKETAKKTGLENHKKEPVVDRSATAVVGERAGDESGMYSRKNLLAEMHTNSGVGGVGGGGGGGGVSRVSGVGGGGGGVGGYGGYNPAASNSNVGVISREDLNNMFRGFFDERSGVVEPSNVPGLSHLISSTTRQFFGFSRNHTLKRSLANCHVLKNEKKANICTKSKKFSQFMFILAKVSTLEVRNAFFKTFPAIMDLFPNC